MSMPIKAIDRLFDRLGLTYGSAWSRKWEGMPINEVKSLWAHELAYYANHLDAVAWALENLPENCPNVVEFKIFAAKPLNLKNHVYQSLKRIQNDWRLNCLS